MCNQTQGLTYSRPSIYLHHLSISGRHFDACTRVSVFDSKEAVCAALLPGPHLPGPLAVLPEALGWEQQVRGGGGGVVGAAALMVLCQPGVGRLLPLPAAPNPFLCPQYLFLTFPRIVFTLGFVAMLSLILGGYLCFMLYLAATNQTTNEWHRGDRIWCQRCPPGAKPPTAKPRTHRNVYSHGFWANLGEVFLPAVVVVGKERKKR